MRRSCRSHRLLAWALAFLLTPFAQEVAEIVEHLANDGHLPHTEHHLSRASDDHDHADDHDHDHDHLDDHEHVNEHRCSPMQHHCTCCASTPAVLTPQRLADWERPAEGPHRLASGPHPVWTSRAIAPPRPVPNV